MERENLTVHTFVILQMLRKLLWIFSHLTQSHPGSLVPLYQPQPVTLQYRFIIFKLTYHAYFVLTSCAYLSTCPLVSGYRNQFS